MNPLLNLIRGQARAGYIEFRWTRTPAEIQAEPKRRMDQDWYPIRTTHEIPADILHLAQQRDVYIGAAIRARRGGGEAAIDQVWALWADCDADKAAFRLDHPPTLEISSGTPGNVHAWWALKAPLPTAWAKIAQRRLVNHVDADMNAKDVARVMRPPGTLNHKHDPPVRVEVVAQRNVSYLAADLVGGLPDPSPPRPRPARPVVVDPSDELERLPVATYYERLTGWDSSGSHVRCPFWDHRSNPAMKLYESTDTWACFACPAGGDVYEFGARLWDMNRKTEFPTLRRRLLDELGVSR